MVSLNRDQAVQKARRHIETIRKEAGLEDGNGTNRNVQNLQNALHTLADELYQKSTHFLLELIQNADDNEYDAVDPIISLTYKNRRLRIDCNERGFSEKNVEAICRVGSSTKAGADRATTYVGEKGIGFKSVFKAADVVWISSNSYTFKFDKRLVLGMIAPIWESFPETTTPSMTSMLLQLSPDYDERRLLSDLKTFDSRMLMFLRRLKEVRITIHEGTSTWKTTLSKSVGSSHNETAVQLIQDAKTMNYLVSSYTATGLPVEPKRPGATESQIMLAFPDVADMQPESQKVYAFLPVRDYGFKFLLQGDFLLSASREDILSDSPWNRALRREFVKAFAGVARAYSQGQLCYVWPRYIPFKPTGYHFFEQARREIIDKLSREPVLKCRTQELVMPSSLIYVPKEFCDKEGVPMTSSGRNDRRYLCHQYDASVIENLEVLGVKRMTADMFLAQLSAYIKENLAFFQNLNSLEWHTRLAEILLKVWFDAKHHEQILKLPVVPLNDGRWVTAEENAVFLPQEAESCIAPEGFQLRLVREDAANNPTTRSLYSQLGLKVLGQESIAHNLVRIHTHESFNPQSMSVRELVSQAAFLFHARADDYQVRYMWFATGTGTGRHRGEQVYLPAETPFAASRYFAGRNDIPFIHSDYLIAGGSDPTKWFEWLEKIAKVSILPRLTEPDPAFPNSFRLSRQFISIMQSFNSSDFLILLRDNWFHYSRWLEDDAGGAGDDARKACRQNLRQALQATPVQCLGGAKRPLQEVFLPIPELVGKAQGQVPFVDVQEPLDPHWQRLKVLGLGVEGDVRFYIRCLEAMSGTRDPKIVDRAAEVLEQIQARCSELPDLVRESFKEKPLVCIPNKKPGGDARWAKVQDCLWGGPECLRRFVALKNVYPSCQRLFRDFFLIADAGIADLAREAKHLCVGDPLSYIKALFLEIEKYLEKDETTTAVDSLQTHSIWPVYTSEHEEDWDTLCCAKSMSSWFVADRTHLLESFRGVVPLLAFQVDDVLKMPLLIRKLGGDKRRLTRAATSIALTVGTTRLHPACQTDLRSRADFIARLIPKKERGKKEKATKLRNLKVFFTTRVIQKWSIQVGSDPTQGRSKDGSVVLSTEHDSLEIYFKEGYFEENKTPGDLIEAIASFCGIEDHRGLLLTIALTENPRKIQEYFQRHGVPALDLEDEPMDDFEDIDDWDPRKLHASTASNAPRQAFRSTVLQADLVRMFATIRYGGSGSGTPGSTSPVRYAVHSKAAWSDDDFSGLDVSDLYAEDSEDDAKSISSTLSGSTLGGSKMRILALGPRIARRSSIFNGIARRDTDDNLEFIGQKKVAEELQRMLGAAFTPDVHWTSTLRTRNGHKVFIPERNSAGKKKYYASFTLADKGSVFTRYLTPSYPDAAKWVKNPPVYHLDVKTTRGDLDAEFSWSNKQLKMSRIYTVPASDEGSIPTDVYFLVRVFNAEQLVKDVQFLMDPWALYLADLVRVKAEKEYRAKVHGVRA